jgi:hypothetical protein
MKSPFVVLMVAVIRPAQPQMGTVPPNRRPAGVFGRLGYGPPVLTLPRDSLRALGANFGTKPAHSRPGFAGVATGAAGRASRCLAPAHAMARRLLAQPSPTPVNSGTS